MFYYTFNTIIGKITLLADETSLKMLSFGEKRPSGAVLGKNKIISDTISELEEYFLGTRIEFDIPVSPEGTDFQKKYGKLYYTYHTVKHVHIKPLQNISEILKLAVQ